MQAILKITSAMEQHAISLDIYNAQFDIETTMDAWTKFPAGKRVLQNKIDRSSPDSFNSYDIIEAFNAWKDMHEKVVNMNGNFNTGRFYSQDEDQIISWQVIDIEEYHDDEDEDDFFDITYVTVDFKDPVRQINGRVVLIDESVTPERIMREYDENRYINI